MNAISVIIKLINLIIKKNIQINSYIRIYKTIIISYTCLYIYILHIVSYQKNEF